MAHFHQQFEVYCYLECNAFVLVCGLCQSKGALFTHLVERAMYAHFRHFACWTKKSEDWYKTFLFQRAKEGILVITLSSFDGHLSRESGKIDGM
jgi:hypothetical protein